MQVNNLSSPFLTKISSLIDEAAQREGSQLSSLFAHWDGAREPEYSMPRVNSLQTAALKQSIKLDNPHIQYLANLPLDMQMLALKAAGSFKRFLQIAPHLSEDGIRYLSVMHLKELEVLPTDKKEDTETTLSKLFGVVSPEEASKGIFKTALSKLFGYASPKEVARSKQAVKTKKVFKLFLRAVYDKLLIDLKDQGQVNQLKAIIEASYQTPLSSSSNNATRPFLYKVEETVRKIIPIVQSNIFKFLVAGAAGAVAFISCSVLINRVVAYSLDCLESIAEKVLGSSMVYFYAFNLARFPLALSAYCINVIVSWLPLPNRVHVIAEKVSDVIVKVCLLDFYIARVARSYAYTYIVTPVCNKTHSSISRVALSAEEQFARRFYWQLEVAKKQWGSLAAHVATAA
ncbi:MAG: hypothetical protein K0S07_232 [Chlamydiales bacterium]|nr:hypothetical protein [Chlamydiales bacterium]